MIDLKGLPFSEVYTVDFEYGASPGDSVDPVCMVAHELRSGRVIRLWGDQLRSMSQPPCNVSRDSVFVAYAANAEFACFLSLGWDMPANVLDLFAEFRNITNGLPTPSGNGLLGALVYFGLSGITKEEKESKRDLVLRGGPWTAEEREDILEYCESDVDALDRLLPKMLPLIDIDRALLRGRYMKAVAIMERNGVPIDTATRDRLDLYWEHIKARLVGAINQQFHVYDGRTFKIAGFAKYLSSHDIPWPRLKTGQLDLSDDTFKEMSQTYPEIAPLRETRIILSRMRLSDLTVGKDGRNRSPLMPFRASSGRNQPSNTKFIFGPSVWLRGLIRPRSGYAVAYIDWEQQEFGIAAALSGDERMMEAYNSGDPYLTFAKQAGAIPWDGTKETHPRVRELFKACALGLQYGMGPKSLAQRIGQSHIVGQELSKLHKKTYPKFWRWSDSAQDYAMLQGKLWTTYGWEIHLKDNINPRSLRNFPMQANGAEILRLACCLATEQGIKVCAPIHDCLLIESTLDEIDEDVAVTQTLMSGASSIVLKGFTLRSEAKIVRYPNRYMDERGQAMWDTMMGLLREVEEGAVIPVLDGRGTLEREFEAKKKEPNRLIKPRAELLEERFPYYHYFTQDPAFKKLLPALLNGEDVGGAGYNTSFNEFVGGFNEAMMAGNIPMKSPPSGPAAGVRMDKGQVEWGTDEVAELIKWEAEAYRYEDLIENPKYEAWLAEREHYVQNELALRGWVESQVEGNPKTLIDGGLIGEDEPVLAALTEVAR